jgi:hypothetical protein
MMKTVVLAAALAMVSGVASAQYVGSDAPGRLPVVTNPVAPVAPTAGENVGFAIRGVAAPVARHGIAPVALSADEVTAIAIRGVAAPVR